MIAFSCAVAWPQALAAAQPAGAGSLPRLLSAAEAEARTPAELRAYCKNKRRDIKSDFY